MSQSIWLAVVTMTTVGYGDFVPKTLGGYVVVFALTLLSVWFLALPVGIIGALHFDWGWLRGSFVVLVMTRTRKCLEKWGYTSAGLSLLFSYVDEFLELMRQLRIGIDKDTAISVFQLFDDDHSGSIAYNEFLRHIFPEEYVQQHSAASIRTGCAIVGQAMKNFRSSSPAHQSDAS
eukprot:g13195.t1